MFPDTALTRLCAVAAGAAIFTILMCFAAIDRDNDGTVIWVLFAAVVVLGLSGTIAGVAWALSARDDRKENDG